MVKLAKSATISDNVLAGLSPSAHNHVVVLVVRNGDIGVDDIANLTEKLLSLRVDSLGFLLLLSDLLIEGLRLPLQVRDISLLVGLLPRSSLLRGLALLAFQIVKGVLGCSDANYAC